MATEVLSPLSPLADPDACLEIVERSGDWGEEGHLLHGHLEAQGSIASLCTGLRQDHDTEFHVVCPDLLRGRHSIRYDLFFPPWPPSVPPLSPFLSSPATTLDADPSQLAFARP